MDLAKLDLEAAADSGATMEVRHPISEEVLLDKDDKPLTITLLGADSKAFRKVLTEYAKKAQNSSNRKGPSLVEQERQGVEMLVRVTTGWSGMVWNDEPLEFNPENCRMLYTQRRWLRTQVDEFIADRTNFFKEA